jgi:hypothetical protein
MLTIPAAIDAALGGPRLMFVCSVSMLSIEEWIGMGFTREKKKASEGDQELLTDHHRECHGSSQRRRDEELRDVFLVHFESMH